METQIEKFIVNTTIDPRNIHSWLRRQTISFVPGALTPLLENFSQQLLCTLEKQGHHIVPEPEPQVDVLLTTAVFGQPVNWRESLLLTARRRYRLDKKPVVFTLLGVTPQQLQACLEHFQKALSRPEPDPAEFSFPGLTERAYHTLYEQGRRGGPMLSLVRLAQSQAMCIRLILVVGDDRPQEAYTFDLVGAHPRTSAEDEEMFYEDLALRIVTAASTFEITDHQVEGQPVPHSLWKSLETPSDMIQAGRELGARRFFTEMVQVANLVNAPAVHDAVSSQYSEGCYATWDAKLGALVATITGSARPVEKDRLTEDELAVISGVRTDRRGALVREVQGKRNDPPSSEAVELFAMDEPLPRIVVNGSLGQVPVARAKLHGHRGVKSYDPRRVEHVYLDRPYYYYPVSCSTDAQARAVQAAFSRSEALNNPHDPRQVVFSVLPGHGIVIVEKWVAGKRPFQVIWECMDSGALQIDTHVPQGPFRYTEDAQGMMVLRRFEVA